MRIEQIGDCTLYQRDRKLRVLDLFSGIGGFSLGLERTGGFETVAFCEIEPFPQQVLRKHWPEVPIYEDVRTLDYDGPIDVICGGYPCQPFSVAGRRKGQEDDRHLWPAMFELIKKHRPTWVIGENVAGHITMGLDDVLSDLGNEGYSARTFVLPACAVDAKHRRDRIWVVANTKVLQRNGSSEHWKQGEGQIPQPGERGCQNDRSRPGRWAPEPNVGRVAHGIPRRVDRLKCLGNAVVPQVVEQIGYALLSHTAATEIPATPVDTA